MLAGALLVGCSSSDAPLEIPDDQSAADIWIAEADGSGVRPLIDWPAQALPLDWAPDGRSILVQSDRDGDPDLWLAPTDGSEPTQLTDEYGAESFAAFSPDGQVVVFSREIDADGGLWSVNVDGSDLHEVLDEPGLDDWAPDWSPDGTRIVFTRTMAGDVLGGELWTVAPDGSGAEELAVDVPDPVWARWSPDGRTLLVATARGDLVTVRPDGTGRQEFPTVSLAWTPAWSPDGTIVAAIGGRIGDDGVAVAGPRAPRDLWRISSDGEVQLLVGSDQDETLVLPSPDGTEIVFARLGG